MKKDKEVKVFSQAADIVGILVDLGKGYFIIDAGKQLTELAEAVKMTRKPGTLSIKLKLKPAGQRDGDINQLEIVSDLSMTKPKDDPLKTIFFITEDMKLTRDDPDQLEMKLEAQKETTGGR